MKWATRRWVSATKTRPRSWLTSVPRPSSSRLFKGTSLSASPKERIRLNSNGESILKLLRGDPLFVQQCRAEIAVGDVRKVLDALRLRGIEATHDDLKVALLDLSHSSETNGTLPVSAVDSSTRGTSSRVDPSTMLRDGFQAGLLGVVRQIDLGYQI